MFDEPLLRAIYCVWGYDEEVVASKALPRVAKVSKYNNTLNSDIGSSGESIAQSRAKCASSGFHGPLS